MLQLPERLGLDLADAFAGDRKLLADLFQTYGRCSCRCRSACAARAPRAGSGSPAHVGRGSRGGWPWIAASTGSTAFLSSMKSPKWLSSSSPIGVSRLIGSLAIFRTLRTFSSGMPSFSANSSGVGSRPISCSIWRRGPDQLVDRLDHVHGDTDGARLVGDRAGDRLADPPGRVGRELVAAPVLELIDSLHQADIAFLDQVQKLQAAVGVLLGDRDDETQVRLDHFLLRLGWLRFSPELDGVRRCA